MNEKMKVHDQPLIEMFLNENQKIRCEMQEGLCSIQNKVRKLHDYSQKVVSNDCLSKEPVSYIEKLEVVNDDLRNALQAIAYINEHLEIITG